MTHQKIFFIIEKFGSGNELNVQMIKGSKHYISIQNFKELNVFPLLYIQYFLYFYSLWDLINHTWNPMSSIWFASLKMCDQPFRVKIVSTLWLNLTTTVKLFSKLTWVMEKNSQPRWKDNQKCSMVIYNGIFTCYSIIRWF